MLNVRVAKWEEALRGEGLFVREDWSDTVRGHLTMIKFKISRESIHRSLSVIVIAGEHFMESYIELTGNTFSDDIAEVVEKINNLPS